MTNEQALRYLKQAASDFGAPGEVPGGTKKVDTIAPTKPAQMRSTITGATSSGDPSTNFGQAVKPPGFPGAPGPVRPSSLTFPSGRASPVR